MNRFIGLFDSGMGGLTVLKEIMAVLPHENTVYFGDTGRAPYGSRSPDILNRYTEQVVRYLIESYEFKLLVAACNTISAICIDHLRRTFSIPILDIIEPVPKKAIEMTRNGRIGVIGTRSTIQSGVYQQKIKGMDSAMEVFAQDCPLLIHLVEEGWANEPVLKTVIAEYLANLKHSKIDTLILACTHYPVIQNTIREYLGQHVTIIDPAVECVKAVREQLFKMNKGNRDNYPERIYLVTDNPAHFRSTGERYLDRKIHNVTLVDIGCLEGRTELRCDVQAQQA